MSDQRYIRAYDNVVTKEWCDNVIAKFESNKDLLIERRPETDHPNKFFDEINFITHKDVFKEEVDHLMTVFDSMISTYAKDCNIGPYQWPGAMAWEAFRMKKYEPETGYFKTHVDAINTKSCNRFLVFFLHLTDGPGGGTNFTDHHISIPRKAGRLVMFPPTWTYPHAGEICYENPKYILGGYLRYINDDKGNSCLQTN